MSKAKAALIKRLFDNGVDKEQAARMAEDMLSTQQRLGRAAEQGFDTETKWYHGTSADITEFDPDKLGSRDFGFLGKGVYITPNEGIAKTYSRTAKGSSGAKVMPLYTSANKPYQITLEQKNMLSRGGPEQAERFKQWVINNGYDSAEVITPSGEILERVVYDPKMLRSPEAKFENPKSGKLLAANAGKSNVITTAAGDVLDRFQVRDALREQGIRGLLENGVIKTYDDAGNPLGRFNTFEEAVASAKKPEGMPDLSYRGSHQAPDKDYGAPFYDLTQMVPEDVYGRSGERLYGFNDPKVDRETFSALRRVRNNPDADVTIYRAVPTNVNDINIGDWVTPSKEYAKLHGENSLGGDYKILEDTVKASKLYSEGYPYELGLVKSPLNAGLFAAMASAVNAPDTVLDPVKEAASKRFTELGLNPDTEYSYASFLPLKRAISSDTRESDVLGGYRPAVPGLLRDLMYQYLLSQEASKRGDYEQATKAAVELLL